jgi:hypothetical protein
MLNKGLQTMHNVKIILPANELEIIEELFQVDQTTFNTRKSYPVESLDDFEFVDHIAKGIFTIDLHKVDSTYWTLVFDCDIALNPLNSYISCIAEWYKRTMPSPYCSQPAMAEIKKTISVLHTV